MRSIVAPVLGIAIALLGACSRTTATAPALVATAQASIPELSIVTTRSDYDTILPPGQTILIDNPYGDVHVRFGGYEHKLDTHAVLQEPRVAAHIALEPGAARDLYALVPRLPAGATLCEGQRLDLAIMVPEGHAVRVHTEQGDIDVRGVHGDVDLKSNSGNISLRSVAGTVQAETGAGQIEASLGKAPAKSAQRLTTRTGNLIVAVDDGLDAELELATSGVFATEYSLSVTQRPGEEPNKHARSVIGRDAAKVALQSRRGEIRLLRRASFVAPDGKQRAETKQTEIEDNDSD